MKQLVRPVIYLSLGVASSYLALTQTQLGLVNVQPQHLAKLTFADGSQYAGGVNDAGLLSGHGKLTWTNATHYQGDFKDGLFNGQGTMRYPSGDSYSGEFIDGMAQGSGKLMFANGDVYQGHFNKDLMHGQGTLTFSDGSRYQGSFINSVIEGEGSWTIPDVSLYTGQVSSGGFMHGQGELVLENNSRYLGAFEDGSYHGQGTFTLANGDTYRGTFTHNEFTGTGEYTSKTEGSLNGNFQRWVAEGEAIRVDTAGNQWRGHFEDGLAHGEGTYSGVDGERYQGAFEYGQYSGLGELTDKDGNQYKGNFSYGMKDGEGTYEYKTPVDGIKKFSGKWRRDTIIAGDESLVILSAETIGEFGLYNQNSLLEEAFNQVAKGTPGQPDLYLLAIAGWGSQEVFNREVNYINTKFEALYNTHNKSILLANSQRSFERPLATVTSIQKSIQHLAEVMDKEEDILLLYATSHGSKKSGLSLDHKGLTLPDLSPAELKKMLQDSGIKYKTIIISACYSGGFIEPLKDEYSLIMTSAAADKTSFGCSDEREFTYFGRALLADSMDAQGDFISAFANAEQLIQRWEADQDLTPSEPMIHTTSTIEAKLNAWRQSLPKSHPELVSQ